MARLAGQAYAAARVPGYDRERYWLWRPEMGETLEEVLVRVGAVLDRVAAGRADARRGRREPRRGR